MNPFFSSKVLSFNQTAEGAATYADLLGAVNNSLPQYLDEVQGMADGAGIDFSEVHYYALYQKYLGIGGVFTNILNVYCISL